MVVSADRQNLVIEAVGLTKVFKDFWGRPKARAVNGIDFSVKRGEVFGLLGPNGSGKSTTVKLILGLLYPTRGTLKVLDESPRNVNIKRRIGYLPEESYLYRYLTSVETLDFFGALFGLVPDERRKRSEQLLEMVGLTNSKDRPVGEFSKGMARRIGLAQALVNDPDLVILDEPTAGLDPIGCREVKDLIRLLASRGKTVILCSHLLADVEDVCDNVVVLYGGKIRSQGGLKEILTLEDRTRIVTPRLEPEVVAEVRGLLKDRLPEEQIHIDQPTMNLEDFFLDVVRRARAASVDTAGAQGGGQIAAYLRGSEQAESEDLSQKVLEALKRTSLSETETVKPKTAQVSEEKATHLDEAKLAKLAPRHDAEVPSVEAEATDSQELLSEQAKSADNTEASKKLQELLRKKSADK